MKITDIIGLVGLLVTAVIGMLLSSGASLEQAFSYACPAGVIYGAILSQAPVPQEEAPPSTKEETMCNPQDV